jgi:hypothetical protein
MWKPGDLSTWIQRSTSRIPVINENLRVVFYIERNTVVTVDVGSHDLYR